MGTIRTTQKGAVSLFVVIFAALLIITIGTAFIRIMIQGQSQASADDLSRSALDSANAGVEDVKRVVASYTSQDCAANPSAGNCGDLRDALYKNGLTNSSVSTDDCKATIKAGIVTASNGGEVLVGSDTGMDQAYTCVNVQMNTDDYSNTVAPGETRMVHLQPGAGQKIKYVTVEWFSAKNLRAATQGSGTIDLTDPANPSNLNSTALAPSTEYTTGSGTTVKQWQDNKPSVMRTQLFQYDRGPGTPGSHDGFKLSDLDTSKTDTDTVFLYPSTIGQSVPDPVRPNLITPVPDPVTFGALASVLQQIKCKSTFSVDSPNFACTAEFSLPDPIDNDPSTPLDLAQRDAYLRLAAPYNSSTDFRVKMYDDSGNLVQFSGVQPVVDSTGRADQLFRRVKSRIEASGNGMPLINAALDVTGDLCKTFTVGTTTSQYNQGSCAP